MPIGEQIASLFVTVGADTGGFNRGLRGVQNNVRNAGRDLMNLATMAAGALGGAAIISTVSNFENKMAELQARTGLGADEMARMRDVALEMGSTTVFSATQSADALLQLVASGSTAEEAIGMLNTVLDLAASSGLDLGYAADAITDILAMFDLDPAAATEVSDALVTIAGISSADVTDVIEAFNNVGPIASDFGMNVDELAAAIGILADQGIKGADAGTQIKSMLLTMSQDTPAVKQAWDDLGTSLYDLEGNIRPLDDVLADIKEGLEGMTDEEQNRLISDLAGNYGQLGLRALLSSDGIGATVTEMEDAATAADVAAARSDTFQGSLDRLKNSAEVLAIEVLTPFIDNVLTPLAEKLTEIVGAVTDWADENPELSSTITTLIGGFVLLGIFGGGLSFILSGIGTLLGVGGAIFTGLIALSGAALIPLLPLALLAGGILVVKGLLDQEWEGIVTTWSGIIENGVIIVETLFQRLGDAAQTAMDKLRELFNIQPPSWISNMMPGGELYELAGGPQVPTTDSPNINSRGGFGSGGINVGPGNIIRPPGRAFGGSVMSGMPYLIGERGPELFVPPTGGRIVSNDRLGGGGGPVTLQPIIVELDGKVLYQSVVKQDRLTNGKTFR